MNHAIPTPVVPAMLLAAGLHAGWNAIVRGGNDRQLAAALVAGVAALLCAAMLPFLPQPALAGWPWLAASVVVHWGYYALLVAAYRAGEMGQVYPVMRGTAPLLVALAGALVLGQAMPPVPWAGVALICAGVGGMACDGIFRARATGTEIGAALPIALANGVVIALYTVLDSIGVRRGGAPVAYAAWDGVLAPAPMLAWVFLRRGAAFASFARARFGAGLLGGCGTLGSYVIVLWCMTQAPVATVAALRETSIGFAMLISVLVLREHAGRARLAAAALIAAGTVLIRLG